MREPLSRKNIANALRNDPKFRQSLGIPAPYSLTRTFGLVWLGWMVLLIVTPLPEAMLLNRLSILAAAFLAAFFMILDSLRSGTRIANMSQRLYNILEIEPHCELQRSTKPGFVLLKHPKFSAECRTDTGFLFSEMTELEEQTISTLRRIEGP